jgi:hypothetical protein
VETFHKRSPARYSVTTRRSPRASEDVIGVLGVDLNSCSQSSAPIASVLVCDSLPADVSVVCCPCSLVGSASSEGFAIGTLWPAVGGLAVRGGGVFYARFFE